MRYVFIFLLSAFTLLLMPLSAAAKADVVIAPLEKIQIDGDLSDWKQPHFHEALPFDHKGIPAVEGDREAVLHLAWRQDQVLVGIDVIDDQVIEESDILNLWRKDSVELFFSPGLNDPPLHIQLSPGLSADNPEMRIHTVDRQTETERQLATSAFAFRKTPTGYTFEAAIDKDLFTLPDDNELAMQVYVNDADAQEYRKKLVWFPYFGAHTDFEKLYTVETGDKYLDNRPEDIRMYLSMDTYDLRKAGIRLVTDCQYDGTEVTLFQNNRETASSRFKAEEKRATADIDILIPENLTWQNPRKAFVKVEGVPRRLEIDYWSLMPHIDEIRAFVRKDSQSTVAANADVLFYGSSSIRFWESLEEDFPGLSVLNRGFGGSTAPEANLYAAILLPSHNPDIIVLYEGDNDLINASQEQFRESYRELLDTIRRLLPETKIIMLPIKPSPARAHLWDAALLANQWIEETAKTSKELFFVDTVSSMLTEKGEIRDDLFREDLIHMNAAGYKIWKDRLRPLVYRLSKKPLMMDKPGPLTGR